MPVSYLSGRAKAARVSDASIGTSSVARRPLPPAAITTICLCVRFPRNVMGVAWPLASRRITQSSLPVFESKARKRLSFVPAIKTSPPAVAIEPPRFGTPVLGIPFASNSSTTPRGTFQAILIGFGGDGGDVLAGDRDSGERRRLDGKWLSGPSGLSRQFTRQHGALFDREQGFARKPIEYEDKSHFCHLNDDGNFTSSLANSYQTRGRRRVMIPEVVMNHLEIPNELACRGVQRHERVAEQILTSAVRTVKIV